ncbi:two component response regulator [Rhodobacteraceae bacterium KLH11]|nr:two component response regulator [Rhodobacteraceae bacterium KLH11]
MKILLVEDDQLHMTYLNTQVNGHLGETDAVLTAGSGREAEQIARAEAVSAIVMDLRMRDRNGIEAARTIWSERPDTRILFWSNHSDEAYLRGISRIVPKDAAYGYVLKTAPPERLALALQAVLFEGQVMIDREIHSLQSLQARSAQALTETEHQILLDVSLGLPDKTIAQRRNLSLRTVQNRLMSIYEKLNIQDDLTEIPDLQINKRTRAISCAIRLRIINAEDIVSAEEELLRWLR